MREKNYRQRMAEQTRRAIVDKAIEMFKEYGYGKVTITDIVKAAGMSRGSFYSHFDNKDDLLSSAIFFDMDNDYQEYFENVILPEEVGKLEPLDILRRFLSFVNSVLTKHGPDLLKHYYSYIVGNSHILLRSDRHYLEILRYILDLYKKEHSLEKLNDEDKLIEELLILQRITAIEWAMHDGELPIEHWDYLIDGYIDRIRTNKKTA